MYEVSFNGALDQTTGGDRVISVAKNKKSPFHPPSSLWMRREFLLIVPLPLDS